MRQAGVLSRVLPESEKWGIDAVHGLIAAERDLGWPAQPLLRLAAMVPPDAARMKAMAERLRFSSDEANRLQRWALTPAIEAKTTEGMLAKTLYLGDRQAVVDRLKLSLSAARARVATDDAALTEAGGYARLLAFAEKWEKPAFPVKSADMSALGLSPGPKFGALLKTLETEWVEKGFQPDRGALLERAAEILNKS